jgi:hypothetical protein
MGKGRLAELASEFGTVTEVNGHDSDVTIIDFDYDPLEVEAQTRRVKLVFNAYVESSPEYNAASGRDKPVPQWRQVFEDVERTDDEGNPRKYYQNINLGWFNAEGEFRKFGRNGLPFKVATAWLDIGVPISPNDPASEAVIGAEFNIERREEKMGNFTKNVWYPVS